ncbi:hypothetical protein TorRG33x02_099190 [Trema orientale]|uniref:Uncharacterized protein n=1 Tax=Trema orientale TaxID=63057 RepID=A0A2P5F8R1_TREOI|nr:hypothetical protein TorRG33x02_099190 [Trema orientale]
MYDFPELSVHYWLLVISCCEKCGKVLLDLTCSDTYVCALREAFWCHRESDKTQCVSLKLSGEEGELSILVVGWGSDSLTFSKGRNTLGWLREWTRVVTGQEDAGMAGSPLGPDPRWFGSSHRVYLGFAVAGEGVFEESPQPAPWTTFSSRYNDDVNVDYIEDELQFKYSSIYNDDLHEEDEEKADEDEDEDENEDEEYEEANQKIMSEIEHLSCKNLDCKHVDGVERLVRVCADLQRKDK